MSVYSSSVYLLQQLVVGEPTSPPVIITQHDIRLSDAVMAVMAVITACKKTGERRECIVTARDPARAAFLL